MSIQQAIFMQGVFSLDYSTEEEEWLTNAKDTLDDLLNDEATEEYQHQFWDLKDNANAKKLAEGIYKSYSGKEKFNLGFLTNIIQYTYKFFQDTKRDHILNNVEIYNMSHFHTPALFAAKLGFNFSTILGIYIHDNLEEIMDTICKSEYAKNLKQLEKIDDSSLRRMIHSLNKSFPDKHNKKEQTAQKQVDNYKLLRARIIRLIVQDFRDLRKNTVLETKPSAEEYYAEIIDLDVLTRVPGEPWKNTINRIFNINNYAREFHLPEIPRKIRPIGVFNEYIEQIRNTAIEIKLFDALHNQKTQGQIIIPDISQTKSDSAIDLDTRMKSLLKRFYTIDFAKGMLLQQRDESKNINDKYKNIYRLHRLLSSESQNEAENIYKAIENRYNLLEIKDKKLKHQYGFKEDQMVTYQMIFKKIKKGMNIYAEKTTLLDKITKENDAEEKAFEKRTHVSFAGTINRIKEYADNHSKTLYNGYNKETNVVDCFKDTYALRTLFQRYLCKDTYGNYNGELNTFFMDINNNLR